MVRFTLICNSRMERWYVRDLLRERNSAEYTLTEARELGVWLQDRETGYQLTHQKISDILYA